MPALATSVPLAMRTDLADGYADGYAETDGYADGYADADADGYADGCDVGGQGRHGVDLKARWKAREACVAAAVGLTWSVLSACALMATVYAASVSPSIER